MRVFNYNPATKEYIDSNDADESPLEPGVFLLPANATFTSIPAEIPVNYSCVWAEDHWELQEKNASNNSNDMATPIEDLWMQLRIKRTHLLFQSDYIFIADYPPLEPSKIAEWKAYRQALRDLPANTTDPTNVIFPIAPSLT